MPSPVTPTLPPGAGAVRRAAGHQHLPQSGTPTGVPAALDVPISGPSSREIAAGLLGGWAVRTPGGDAGPAATGQWWRLLSGQPSARRSSQRLRQGPARGTRRRVDSVLPGGRQAALLPLKVTLWIGGGWGGRERGRALGTEPESRGPWLRATPDAGPPARASRPSQSCAL